MQRLQSLHPDQAEGRTKDLLATVERTFGMIPNTTRVMAHSPAVLDTFLAITTAMSGTRIGDRLHTQIKLAASEANSCTYCTSILCAIGPSVGLTTADLVAGRSARAEDHRTDAALRFAKSVLETRGRVSDDDLRAVQQAGFGATEIVEIVASVVAGCFTNFLNNVADTTLDVPEAESLAVHAA
ncbi:MAG TPA: carboxymuconolactone decarboxylase family protein [Thermoanaerobaculia bacterium]|nr:carboxymuconolactone decarboxylase family protein [Thermoanaerobaculia bacterium]